MEISVRELKNNLSACLRQVAAGQELIVTSHKRPVARLLPIAPLESSETADIERIKHLPWVHWNGKKPAGLGNPVKLASPARIASDLVLEDRQ